MLSLKARVLVGLTFTLGVPPRRLKFWCSSIIELPLSAPAVAVTPERVPSRPLQASRWRCAAASGVVAASASYAGRQSPPAMGARMPVPVDIDVAVGRLPRLTLRIADWPARGERLSGFSGPLEDFPESPTV
jgi:hypothetical protein